MPLNKIILYYGFAPIADPQAVMLWQRTLCETLELKGRILISPHGINGTLGGKMENLKKYAHATKEFKGFSKIDFKWSAGTGNEFSKLMVKVRKELVAFTTPDEVQVDITGVVNGGKHLKPHQVNELVEKRGDDVVFFDGRNAFDKLRERIREKERLGKLKLASVCGQTKGWGAGLRRRRTGKQPACAYGHAGKPGADHE